MSKDHDGDKEAFLDESPAEPSSSPTVSPLPPIVMEEEARSTNCEQSKFTPLNIARRTQNETSMRSSESKNGKYSPMPSCCPVSTEMKTDLTMLIVLWKFCAGRKTPALPLPTRPIEPSL